MLKIKDKLKYLINPDLLEKSSLVDSIKYLLDKYQNELANKTLLDVGCGSKPYENLFIRLKINYQGIDFKNYSRNFSYQQTKPDYFFLRDYKNNYQLTQFKDNSFEI